MAQHSRTAHFLSALATLSQALARRQEALAIIEQYRELLERTMDQDSRAKLVNQRQLLERNKELAELELGGIDLWINTMSGSIASKEQLSHALKAFTDTVAGKTFEQLLANDGDMDLIVAGIASGRPS